MPGEITGLLAEIRGGNRDAESQLAAHAYAELHRIAARYMSRERPDHTLQATILVDEAFLQLVKQEDRSWQNRSHFFAAAAQVMRHILIDHARSRNATRRGGPHAKLQLDDVVVFSDARCEELIALDEALSRLATWDPRQSRIVELRFFTGLTEEEIAEALGISPRTVKREWQVAKAWLHGELSSIKHNDPGAVGAP